jgi:hypothetical protein
VRKYIVGKPRVTGVLISPQDRQRIRLTLDDLRHARITSSSAGGNR